MFRKIKGINQNRGKERGEQGSDSGVRGQASDISAGVEDVDVERSSTWLCARGGGGDIWKSEMSER